MKKRYIAFDCETGGLKPECSLLTTYLVVLDEDMTTVLGDLDLRIKPDANAPYVVTSESISINKIDLIKHDKDAITETEAGQRLYKFLDMHSDSGSMKMVPIGHNVFFDETCLQAHLISNHNWNKFVSYRRLDTGTVAEFMRAANMIPDDVRGGLGYLCEHFGVSLGAEAHTAKGDTVATVKLLRKMMKRVNNEKR